MSADQVVQKYSQALFDACVVNKNVDAVASELAQVTKLFCQTDAQSFFNSPFNSVDNKVMVAKSALEGKCAPEVFNFIVTVVEKNRMMLLQQMSEAMSALVRASGGQTEGVLYSASDVAPAFVSEVEAKVGAVLNKKVKLKSQKDASLLAGYKISVGGWTMDDSAQFHLNKIKEDISKRGI